MSTSYLRLDVGTIFRVVRRDIATSHVFDRFELAIHLTDAPKSDTRSSVELAVFDKDVGRVCFWRDRIVAVVYNPPTEGDVVGVNSVGPICVYGRCLNTMST